MQLSDLKLGDVIQVNIPPSSQNSRSFKIKVGMGTVVGLDTRSSDRQVLLGWKEDDPARMSDFIPHEHVGAPMAPGCTYLPGISKDGSWTHVAWVNLDEVVGVGGGATCPCGYYNPYATSPYQCTGCKLWAHVAG